jgi:hypothetical protein
MESISVGLKQGHSMYCCKCGTQTGRDAAYCHKCGEALFPISPTLGQRPSISEDQLLAQELLAVKLKPGCHACGRVEGLSSYTFGLGRPVSTRREWSATALSVAFSAVTIPLLGVGGIQLPGKSIRMHVLTLTLVLCLKCRDERRGCEASLVDNSATVWLYTVFES